MKKNTKKASGLYLYIEPLIESGSQDDIARAKKNYWKQYRKEWNKNKHQECKCFKILLDPHELNSVLKSASAYHLSATKFIKQSALVHSKQEATFDKATVAKIRELLVLHYGDLETMLEVEEHDVSKRFGDQLLQYQSQLETEILRLLNDTKL